MEYLVGNYIYSSIDQTLLAAFVCTKKIQTSNCLKKIALLN
jgi:hypothetical protein